MDSLAKSGFVRPPFTPVRASRMAIHTYGGGRYAVQLYAPAFPFPRARMIGVDCLDLGGPAAGLRSARYGRNGPNRENGLDFAMRNENENKVKFDHRLTTSCSG